MEPASVRLTDSVTAAFALQRTFAPPTMRHRAVRIERFDPFKNAVNRGRPARDEIRIAPYGIAQVANLRSYLGVLA
jgi:hypothetical protein